MISTMEIRPDVADALQNGDPVVALESTLIAHGLPRPDNLQLAREVESLIREEGVVPATIGVVDGAAKVGLEPAELELMANTDDIPKLSIRDLSAAVAKKNSGATTVSATAHLAARAGINLFATGGLGGVHREARESWDVSADLATLSRTPIAVVCSGVKSILDVSATLEQLETLGVLVVGYRTSRFPGFYLADSGENLDWVLEDEEEAARLLVARRELSGDSAVVISNPIPENEQLDPGLHDRVLKAALDELRHRGVRGKEVTPFLLNHFRRETGGESLRVNKQIIRNNARLAARIAAAHANVAR
ncbi:MAG: pseudouridine-5'-phosphate glycosidase [Rubrobacteraceae bacterium]